MTTITVTANKYNTLFIDINGVEVADSSTFRRQRGFWNRLTQKWVKASDFTPKKVKADPSKVLAYLVKTGMPTVGRVVVDL